MTRTIHLVIFVCLATLFFGISNLTSQGTEIEQSSRPYADVIEALLNFSVDDDCTLPCFYGIQPNETRLLAIKELSTNLFGADEAIVAQFDKPFEREDGLLDYTLIVNPSDVAGFFNLSFMVSPEDKILRRFKAHLFQPEKWSESNNLDISEILATLGTPDEIYIAIAASQPPQFGIVLGYKNLGVVFLYTYRFEPEQLTQSDEPIPLCGSWSATYSVDVWVQAVDEDFYEALLEENLFLYRSEIKRSSEIVYRAFWPLERMTTVTIEDLTQFLVENPDWCFDALSYEELLASGYSY